MPWPLKKEEPEVKKEEEKKEKTPAELIAESLAPVLSGFNDLKKDFDEFRTKAVTHPEPKTPVNDQKPPDRVSVLDDEEAAFVQRLTPLAIETLNTRFELMFDRVSREYISKIGSDAWAQIEPDIRKSLEDASVSPVLRANPQYIKNTVRMIMGEKAESGFRFDAKDKKFFLENGEHPDPNTKVEKPEDGLNDRQIKAAKSFGMSLEDYKKSLGGLEVVS